MNFKKVILYLLLGIFSLIFAYNYLFVPMLYQRNNGMGMMEGHMGGYSNNYGSFNNYGSYLGYILIIIFILAALIVADRFNTNSRSKCCKSCGMIIEDDKWNVCPKCGSRLKK